MMILPFQGDNNILYISKVMPWAKELLAFQSVYKPCKRHVHLLLAYPTNKVQIQCMDSKRKKMGLEKIL